jgi:hypothetical protein
VRFINFDLAAGLLSACGSTPNNQAVYNADNAVNATTNVTQPNPLPPSENNITIDAVSVDGVIATAANDADSVGTVCFQFSGQTFVV